MKLPSNVQLIIKMLSEAGYRADVVGGPVRDFLLGKEPSDYDITTSATPDRVKEIFSEYRMVDTGIKHGTVSLILDGKQYEITTYRIDGEYLDARRPESVSFTESLAEDLCRRDFTVNAMCYNPTDGITDLHGGIADLERKIIRAVGDPAKRFSEDALRILRAVRFAATLGFTLEEKTAIAAVERRELLRLVSSERIYTEWRKLLAGENAYSVIKEHFEIISVFLPEIPRLCLPSEERFNNADWFTRMLSLFALALGDGAAAAFAHSSAALKTDRQTQKNGTAALYALGKYAYKTDRDILYLLMSLGESLSRQLVRLEVILGYHDTALEGRIDELVFSGAPYKISDLEIDGTDLAKIGLHGQEIGVALRNLLLSVVRGEVENDRDALLYLARKQK